jgi:hypothetical protein
MGEYPDRPNEAVEAQREALFALFQNGDFDAAADCALALEEPVIRYSPIEAIADGIFRARQDDALLLYGVALRSAIIDASYATSGAEGRQGMAEVQRLEKKLAARGGAVHPRSR